MAGGYWFRPRRFGYGAGMPSNWKGWALLVVLVGGIFGGKYVIQLFLPRADWGLALIGGTVFFILPMVVLAMYKTGAD
ncbi:MAG: hypothetical protein ACTHLR_08480 [Rhizomicrobium sp.]